MYQVIILNMAWNGLTSFEKAGKLLEFFKTKNLEDISEADLAKYIGMFIGCSKYFKTVRNYINMMIGYDMIKPLGKGMFHINYDILKDIEAAKEIK